MSHVLTRGRGNPGPMPSSQDHEMFKREPETLATKTARRKAQQLFRSLVVYAKMLGLRWNVQIVFDPGTTTAKTNGEVIYIRPLQIGNESDAVLMECLIDHEAGVHCRQTNFELMRSRFGANTPELLTTLHNVFEDVWGERELKKVKPGCARSIAAGLAIMVERGIFGPPKEDAHIASLLVGGLVNGLRSRKLGQTMLEPFFVQRWQRLEQHFGKELADKIWQEAQKVDQCFDTGSAIDLAEGVIELLSDFLQQQAPLPQQGNSSDSGDDSGDDSHGKGEGDSEQSRGSDTEASASSTGNAGETQDGKKTGSNSSAGESSSDGQPSRSDNGGQQRQDRSGGGSSNDPTGSERTSGDGNPNEADERPQPGNDNQGAQGGDSTGETPSDAVGGQQARSEVSGGPKKKPDARKPEGEPKVDPTDPQDAPDQAAISNGGEGDPKPSPDPGTAAPQPAPMTPEEFKDALKAVMSTMKATRNEAGTGELADAMAEALNASTATNDASSAGISAGNIWYELDTGDLAENDAVDQIVSEAARPIALRLGSKLDALLEAKVTANSYLKRHGGRRMHSGKLVRLQVSGNQNVYKASDDIEEIATAVHVLTDISASMNAGLGRAQPELPPAASTEQKKAPRLMIGSSRIGAAAAVSRALGDIFHRFDVPFALSYFGSCLTKVKGYDDNWRRKRNVYWTKLEPSTCTDQALIGIIPELAVRTEERKLLLLVSDGVPAHAQATALALSEARKLGIDVCVVLVTSNDPSSDRILSAFTSELDKWEIPHATARVFEELAQAVFDAVKAAF
jgi:hypothetical protein